LGDRTLIIIVVASFVSDRSGTCGANGPTGIQKIEIEDYKDDDEGRGRFYVRMWCVKPLGADVGAGPMFAERIDPGSPKSRAIGFSYRSRARYRALTVAG
jgi:hypothetical protein